MARSKYETNVQPFLENIEWWLQQGATIEEIAGRLDLAQSSIKLYLAKGRAGEKPYSDFSYLFDKVHVNLDDSVEAALYKKTQGYNAKVAKNVKVKCVDYDEVTGKKIREYEEIKEVFDEVHIPADTNAQIFWLTRRQGKKWPYKPEVREDDDSETGVIELGTPAPEPVPSQEVMEQLERKFADE